MRSMFLLVRSVAVVGSLLAMVGCAHYPRWQSSKDGFDESIRCDNDVVVSRLGSKLRYEGELTAQGLWALKRLSQGRPISTLVITSTGGEINAGMDFGDWVFERGVSVIVEDYCLSSCANYIFTAAWHKTVQPGAVVAWHGSARQRDLPDQLVRVVDDQVQALALAGERHATERDRRYHEVTQYLNRAIERQDAFFSKIGVSEFLTRIGNERYGIKGFYFLPQADMTRFGIQNVVLPAGYDDMDTEPLQRRLNAVITRLKIGSDDEQR